MLRAVMSLCCLSPFMFRRLAARRFKGYTRQGSGGIYLLIFQSLEGKVAENKRGRLCKILKFFQAILNPVHPTPLRRLMQRSGVTSFRGAAGDVAIQSGTRGSGLLRSARNDGSSRKETIARYIRSRLWLSLSAGNIMSVIRNILSNITQNKRSVVATLTSFGAASHYPAVADFCYAEPNREGYYQ
ncbi:hypothetical protein NYA22BAC_00871 [Parasphingorhabdus sp. NYA22]